MYLYLVKVVKWVDGENLIIRGVKITELANVAANGSVCVFDDTTNTISMNEAIMGHLVLYQIDIALQNNRRINYM